MDKITEFKQISRDDIPQLLSNIETYNENERFNRHEFDKYVHSEKEIDSPSNSIFYGCFEDGKCMALAYLNKTPMDFILMAEIQSFRKGYGKLLIDNILQRRFYDIWWASDPIDGDEALEEYYRQFGMDEYKLNLSKWTNTPETIFFRCSSEESRDAFLEYISRFDLEPNN